MLNKLQVAIGCNWLQLVAVGCNWLQLVAVGCNWLQLVAVGCSIKSQAPLCMKFFATTCFCNKSQEVAHEKLRL